MATLSVDVLDEVHRSVMEVAQAKFASVDWFLTQAVMDKLQAVRTDDAAPPRLAATAHRITGAIVLTADLHVSLPWRNKAGEVSPDNAVTTQELFLKDTIRKIADDDSDTVLGNAIMKILSESTRDTAAFGHHDVDKGRALLFEAVGVRSERANWKATERVGVALESIVYAFGEKDPVPHRVTFSPLVKATQDCWLGTKSIPDLVINQIRPKQLGQVLRRSFVFCDMDP